MQVICGTCSFMYDSEQGGGRAGCEAPPGTAFEDLPPEWSCPVCGATKEEFVSPEDRPMCNRWP